MANQKLERNSRSGNVFESVQDLQRVGESSYAEPDDSGDDDAATVEETTLIRLQQIGGSVSSASSSSASATSSVDGTNVFTSVVSNGANKLNRSHHFVSGAAGVLIATIMMFVIKY